MRYIVKEVVFIKFVVFLDVDGVLNIKTTVERTPEFYDARVEILAKAVRKYRDTEMSE